MTPTQRLRGKAIFLSASVPLPGSSYRYDLNVDDAVIALARMVFAKGGQLVFGGHPSISPLILTIAAEYAAPHELSTPLALIYQSEIFRPVVPEHTHLLLQLGYGRIVWTPSAEGERLETDPESGRKQAPRSLAVMRERMISETQPAAFVAIGGMEGIELEVDLFHRLRESAPVYALATTGGAAAGLAGSREYVRAIDREIETKLRAVRGDSADYRPAALYPVVMAEIVRELAGERPNDP